MLKEHKYKEHGYKWSPNFSTHPTNPYSPQRFTRQSLAPEKYYGWKTVEHVERTPTDDGIHGGNL